MESMPIRLDLSLPWEEFASGPGRRLLGRTVLPAYLLRQRWFPAKARRLASVEVDEAVRLPVGDAVLLVVTTTYEDGGRQRFAMPMAHAGGDAADRIRHESAERIIADTSDGGVIHDDMARGLGSALLLAMAHSERWATSRGELTGEKTPAFDALLDVADLVQLRARRITGEQSNTSVIFGDRIILKLIRRLEPGLNPDYEIGRHLTDRVRFEEVPALAGAILWRDTAREPIIVSVAQAFAPGARVLREQVVTAIAAGMREALGRAKTTGADPQIDPARGRDLVEQAAALGRKTGELHRALADAHGDPAFEPEATSADHLARIARDMQAQVDQSLNALSDGVGTLSGDAAALASRILAARSTLRALVESISRVRPGLTRIRVHGDFQLDQVLVADGRFVLIDFEGEPLRPIAERRSKFLAVKDVAGMARSFSYAAYSALFDVAGTDMDVATRLEANARWWQASATSAFVAGYREATRGALFAPTSDSDFTTILSAFIVEKAAYELRYELNHRPQWLRIPLRGMAEILDAFGRE
jgi:trehalose synthase-fused probable maltokinase